MVKKIVTYLKIALRLPYFKKVYQFAWFRFGLSF